MYENLLWIGALLSHGDDFVRDMLEDEAFNRKSLAQLTFKLGAKTGADASGPESLKLRTLIGEIDKQFPNRKKISAWEVAASGPIEMAYFEYGRFSLDAVHCSITALGRHISREQVGDRREYVINVVPNTPEREIISTIVHACRALLHAAVAVGDILGDKVRRDALALVMAEFDKAAWASDSDPGIDVDVPQ